MNEQTTKLIIIILDLRTGALRLRLQTPYGDLVQTAYPEFGAFLDRFIVAKARVAYYTMSHEALCYGFWRFVTRDGLLPKESIGRHWFGRQVARDQYASKSEVSSVRLL